MSERNWYAIYTYSGNEERVKVNMTQRVKSTGMEDKIFDILIPTEDKVEVKDGKETVKKDEIFPGYVLVQMIMDDDSWYVVRNTPGVIGFASAGTDPVPVSEEEIQRIKQDMGMEELAKANTDLEIDQKVKVTDGVLEDHVGVIKEINYETKEMIVQVSMFGRETPVELEFGQVEKV
ncbi:transcription termination/antitermination factor NusG [Halobacteroides halobius DSM 5150]|uniref:Transcription termination/antitermination protein NusG n=1 Tax=Halobacteroides halobius (strain ATCC 35273 / DSM 5150 / MD-1) TaxID=748449 RepID=L0K739_HALHC|nr:transcription termination/antitermination protein NusG [Halobacteroides halobius]AGB40189.1 transcription termination/antitermination factor NusG [Halobacteroides halobius DSM 5150]